MKKEKKFVDVMIWAMTVLLFAMFYIVNMVEVGSYYLLGITAVLAILYIIKNKGIITLSIIPFHGCVLLFGMFSLTSSLWAWNAGYAVEKAITVFEILICLYVVYICYAKERSADALLKAFMWSGYVVIIYALFFFGIASIRNIIGSGGRFSSEFANTNSVGTLAAYTIVISVHYIIQEKNKLLCVGLIPALFVVSASGSKTALILMAGGIFCYFFLKGVFQNSYRKMFKGMLFAVVIFCILVSVISTTEFFQGVMNRLYLMLNLLGGEGPTDTSSWLRMQFIKDGIAQFLETPLIGIGMGNARIIALRNYGKDCFLHNNYIELLANGGVIGFGVYYLMHFYLLVTFFRHRKVTDKLAPIIITLLMLILVLDMTTVTYYTKDHYALLLLCFMHGKNIKERKRNED